MRTFLAQLAPAAVSLPRFWLRAAVPWQSTPSPQRISLIVPDRDGQDAEVAVGYDDTAKYPRDTETNHTYFGESAHYEALKAPTPADLPSRSRYGKIRQ